ncbi:oxygen-binding di-iron domain-containing protein [Desulfonauticus submarinus]
MDWSQPIELAEDIFWVGAKIPEDMFQCHVYLLRQGNESVLFDPGSLLTFEETLKKIRSLIDPHQVKYFICHHQDPDITACISQYEKLFPREDRLVVTHWRTQMLLKHYNWKANFYLVDEHDWCLKLCTGRILKFIFTPYVHFAGNICTYDPKTKVLFSSDIFGGMVSKDTIFIENQSYFEDIKIFHEHYMPSKETLIYALNEISQLDLNLIAPQHGYILSRQWIPLILDYLKDIECGFFKFSKNTKDIGLLSKITNFFHETITALIDYNSFENILTHFQHLLFQFFEINFFAVLAFTELEYIFYRPGTKRKKYLIHRDKSSKLEDLSKRLEKEEFLLIGTEELTPYVQTKDCQQYIVLPLFLAHKKLGLAFLGFKDKPSSIVKEKKFLQKFSAILTHLLSKEINIIQAEKEKEEFYNLAVKDQLTGLYNRFYLNMQMKELISNVIRYNIPLSIILFDIDHFKKVNDTYGHFIGDKILKSLAKFLKNSLRYGDTIIRYGGEEFLLILPYTYQKDACDIANKLRRKVEQQHFKINRLELNITISAGIAFWKSKKKSFEELICQADKNLYKAKKNGRNCVVCS